MRSLKLYDAAKECAFLPYKVCAPAVNGANTTSYYNSTSATGIYVDSSNTSTY